MSCDVNKVHALVDNTPFAGEYYTSIMYCSLRDWSGTQLGHIDHMHISPHIIVANDSPGHDL